MTAKITWYGHATFRLDLADGRVVMIDPWLRENPSCPDELASVERCDIVLLTHGHADHVGDVEPLIKKFDPIVVGNVELCGSLEKRLGCGRYSPMNTGGTQSVEGVRVTLTQAFHSSSIDSPNGPMYAGMPNGLVIGIDGLATLYHAGDTDVFSDMRLIKELFAPAICLLPIGDHFTMGAAGAAIAADILQPQVLIPMHYKTFPILDQSVDTFRDKLSPQLKQRLVVPDVGETLGWTTTGVERANAVV